MERLSTLANGLTIATDRVPGARSVAIGVWIAIGSRDERPEHSGISHFLEHLLFKGTATRSAQDIARSIDRYGGDFNAYTTKEHTAYYCRIPARHAAFVSSGIFSKSRKSSSIASRVRPPAASSA